MRVAFYGRVSTDDAQDPSLSGALDAVIVESIDRLSRMTADGTRIERELEERDVALFAADEPLNSSATAILTRRVKQGVAEWYVRDLIERSRAGMEESVRQGWHTGGRPPYGYMLEPHPHPNPQKAREGRKKHRLILDPVKAPIVAMIFADYTENGMGLSAICEKLNRDTERYPPPSPNRKDENGLPPTWSRSQLRSLLRNPKYTGYNVWGRHDKRKGRPLIRPREQWVWSATPTHEAIISREVFDAVEDRAQSNANAPKASAPRRYANRGASRPGRLYVLRGRVRCGICGRRMEGSHQKGSNWYRCQYARKRPGLTAELTGHPRVLGIKEDVVLEAVREFMAERLFGPDRLRLLSDELAASLGDEPQSIEADRKRLQAEQKKIEEALRRQALRLEEHDNPDHPVIRLATARIEELSAQGDSVAAAMAELESQRPEGPSPEEIEAMLSAIPDLSKALAGAESEELIELLDAFDVEISYDKPSSKLELSAALSSDLIPASGAEKAPAERSRNSGIAGAGFEPATFGL